MSYQMSSRQWNRTCLSSPTARKLGLGWATFGSVSKEGFGPRKLRPSSRLPLKHRHTNAQTPSHPPAHPPTHPQTHTQADTKTVVRAIRPPVACLVPSKGRCSRRRSRHPRWAKPRIPRSRSQSPPHCRRRRRRPRWRHPGAPKGRRGCLGWRSAHV